MLGVVCQGLHEGLGACEEAEGLEPGGLSGGLRGGDYGERAQEEGEDSGIEG